MNVILLEEAARRLRYYVEQRDVENANRLFFQVVTQRIEVMNMRAQQAESRASKAERNLERILVSRAPVDTP